MLSSDEPSLPFFFCGPFVQAREQQILLARSVMVKQSFEQRFLFQQGEDRSHNVFGGTQRFGPPRQIDNAVTQFPMFCLKYLQSSAFGLGALIGV